MGKCIIEIKNNQGKINISVQGLKPQIFYKLCLISLKNNSLSSTYMGFIDIDDNGKGESKWYFDPDNVNNSGLKIEDFNIIAFIVENGLEIISPLVGYIGDEVAWKDKYISNLNNSQNNNSQLENNNQDNNYNENNQSSTSNGNSDNTQTTPSPQQALSDYERGKLDEIKGILDYKKGKLDEAKGKLDYKKGKIDEAQGKIDELKGILDYEAGKKEEEFWKNKGNQQNNQNTNQSNDQNISQNNTPLQPENNNSNDDKGGCGCSSVNSESITIENKTKDRYESFNNLIEKFKKEMMELEEITLINAEEKQAKAQETISENSHIDYIKMKNPIMTPFKQKNENLTWYRISPYELTALGENMWKYINNQFVFSCFKKYKHLMLGVHRNSNNETYTLAIPCKFDPNFVAKGELQGFNNFVPIEAKEDNQNLNNIYGYRLLKIISI